MQRIKWLIRPASDFGPKHFQDNSSDEDCNDNCYRQIKNLRNNRKGKKDVLSLSDKHVDSQVPLASNFDDENDDDDDIDDFYNNNLSSEQVKRNLSKQYSIDLRDNLPLKNHSTKDANANDINSNSKKCMYSRQNMNFISDDLLSEDGGLHMKLSLHPELISKEPPPVNHFAADPKSKFSETNF